MWNPFRRREPEPELQFSLTPKEYGLVVEVRNGIVAAAHNPAVNIIVTQETADAMVVVLTAGLADVDVSEV